MRKFILTILIVGMWGFIMLGVFCAYMNNNVKASDTTDITNMVTAKDTLGPFDPRSLIDPPVDTTQIWCCTVFVDKPCTVWVSADLLFIQKWKAFDALLDSLFMEIK